jgi:hypothetical protein
MPLHSVPGWPVGLAAGPGGGRLPLRLTRLSASSARFSESLGFTARESISGESLEGPADEPLAAAIGSLVHPL